MSDHLENELELRIGHLEWLLVQADEALQKIDETAPEFDRVHRFCEHRHEWRAA